MARFRWGFGVLLAALCMQAFCEDRIRVVNEGGIRTEWMLSPGFKLAMPVYPPEYVTQQAAPQAEACVALGYLINPDGTTSDFSLLKSWTSAEGQKSNQEYWAAFANASAQALSQWRFQPRPEVTAPRPVYTVATMMFAAKSPGLRSRCAIPDLAARLRELRQDSSARRKMNVGLFDRLELDPFRRQRDEVTTPRMGG